MGKRVIGIIGSYRKGGIIDSVVTSILASAEEYGADTRKIYLIDKKIEFCTNCRRCTQRQDLPRGKCIHNDDMEGILTEIEQADGIVFASPINFGHITAVTKRFMERLIVLIYWPWGKYVPKMRIQKKNKKAILVTSSTTPAFLGRIIMGGGLRALKDIAKVLGATPIDSIYIGLAGVNEKETLSKKVFKKAGKAGKKLVL